MKTPTQTSLIGESQYEIELARGKKHGFLDGVNYQNSIGNLERATEQLNSFLRLAHTGAKTRGEMLVICTDLLEVAKTAYSIAKSISEEYNCGMKYKNLFNQFSSKHKELCEMLATRAQIGDRK